MQKPSNATRRAASARLLRHALSRPTVAPVAQYGFALGDVTMPDFTLRITVPAKSAPAGRAVLLGQRLTTLNNLSR